MKRVVLTILIVVLLCVLASATYNALYVRHLAKRYPVPGKLYSVNGYQMHLYCTGTGSPAVVLEGGRGDDWLYWQKVQPELAKTTRVCSYDRAGLGWSDPQPGPRDAIHIAAQLHSLLQQAGETGPLILAGASAGGFYVREYVATYPNEIAGVVFVDVSVPEQSEALPGARDSDAKRKERHYLATVEWLKETSGWARLSGQCKGEVERGLEADRPLAAGLEPQVGGLEQDGEVAGHEVGPIGEELAEPVVFVGDLLGLVEHEGAVEAAPGCHLLG